MNTETQLERAPAPQREDARGLIARLCRELGVAAVADALKEPENAQGGQALVLDIQTPRDRLAA